MTFAYHNIRLTMRCLRVISSYTALSRQLWESGLTNAATPKIWLLWRTRPLIGQRSRASMAVQLTQRMDKSSSDRARTQDQHQSGR
jgi:hypothetical protein